MKIACCTVEMIALIFLLFVSINGGYSYLGDDLGARTDLVSRSTGELLAAWGMPETVVVASDVGLVSPQLESVEIWAYANPVRSVSVRDNVVLSIRWG